MSREKTLYLSDYRRPQAFNLRMVQGEVRPITIDAKGLGSPTVSTCTWQQDVSGIFTITDQAVSESTATATITADLNGSVNITATLTYSTGEKTIVRIAADAEWNGQG